MPFLLLGFVEILIHIDNEKVVPKPRLPQLDCCENGLRELIGKLFNQYGNCLHYPVSMGCYISFIFYIFTSYRGTHLWAIGLGSDKNEIGAQVVKKTMLFLVFCTWSTTGTYSETISVFWNNLGERKYVGLSQSYIYCRGNHQFLPYYSLEDWLDDPW